MKEEGIFITRFGYKTNNWSKVYFIQGLSGGPIKIGHTDDLEKRLKQMQTGNPDELTVLHVTRGGKIFEDELHHKFMKYHLRGEWFEPARDILIFIEELKIKDKENPKLLSIVEFTLACGEPLTTESKKLLQELINGSRVNNDPYWDRYKALLKNYQSYTEDPDAFLKRYGDFLDSELFKI